MELIQKAIWFVESHFSEQMMFEDTAARGNVSAWHPTRAVATTTGW